MLILQINHPSEPAAETHSGSGPIKNSFRKKHLTLTFHVIMLYPMKFLGFLSFAVYCNLSLQSIVALSNDSGVRKNRTPSPLVKQVAKSMGMLKPAFAAEANLQASLLGSKVDSESVSKEIAAEIKSKPVVIYTYGLSPFSTEALAILDSTGVEYRKIELGAEWFLLDGKDSVKRVLLSGFVENGATSLPKVFVRGQCIGGCAELAESVTSGSFSESIKVPQKWSFLQVW